MSTGNLHRPRRRQRKVQPRELIIGAWVQRRSDRAVFQVRQIWRHDKRLQLAPDLGGDPFSLTFPDLERGFDVVSRP